MRNLNEIRGGIEVNKVILMGRLTKAPEIRYSQSVNPIAIARYTLAVNRRFKKQGEPEADFINVIAFGKAAEFAEKYFKKGQMISVVGRLQVRSWDDNGQKRWITDVVIEEQHFAESKAAYEAHQNKTTSNDAEGFYPIDESIEDEELPF